MADRPLLLTRDPLLLDDLLRLAAAAGCEVEVVPDASGARPRWPVAPTVLLGGDSAEDVVSAGLPRRGGVVLVGRDPDDASVWRQAVATGAEHVVLLPDAEPWIVELLADSVEADGPPARVVAVVGGRGGAGATCLAVALALAGVRRGLRTLLMDGDPLGGGIDLAVGVEEAAGLRWPDLAGSRGRVPRDALVQALPAVDDLAVLSWDRGELDALAPEAMAAVLGAARRASELVVVDLNRAVDDAARRALADTDVALLVVPAEVRSCAAAARVARLLREACADVRAVVRSGSAELEPDLVAASLGVPLAGVMRQEPGLAAALERGEPPGRRARSALGRLAGRLVEDLVPRQHAA